MKVLGRDTSCMSHISLKNLKKFFNLGYKLQRVILYGGANFHQEFIFDEGIYFASGFAWGNDDIGSKSLHEAILMFEPNGLNKHFHETTISSLSQEKNWIIIPGVGISKLSDQEQAHAYLIS